MLLNTSAKAQKIFTNTGFGYYNPQIGGDSGNILYADVGAQLPTEFILGVGFALSDVFTQYDENVPLFEGFRSIRNYYHFRLFVDRKIDFGTKNKHSLNMGTGLTYIQFRYAEPFVFYNPNLNELSVGLSESDRMQDDAGLLLHADYGFKIGRFVIGVRSELHFLLEIGLGGIILSPNLHIDF